jgi:hypothetical protein
VSALRNCPTCGASCHATVHERGGDWGWGTTEAERTTFRAAELDATPPAGAGEAVERVRHFVAMLDAKPLRGIDDEFYNIHTGTEWAASLRLSDLRLLAAPTPLPEAVREADELLAALGLDASRFRTEGGALNAGKVRAALLHPESYSGLYLPNDHDFGHSAKFGGELCFACGAVKGTARASQPCVALRAITGEGKP